MRLNSLVAPKLQYDTIKGQCCVASRWRLGGWTCPRFSHEACSRFDLTTNGFDALQSAPLLSVHVLMSGRMGASDALCRLFGRDASLPQRGYGPRRHQEREHLLSPADVEPLGPEPDGPSPSEGVRTASNAEGVWGVCEHTPSVGVRRPFEGVSEGRRKGHVAPFGGTSVSLLCCREGGPIETTLMRPAVKTRSIAVFSSRLVVPFESGSSANTVGA